MRESMFVALLVLFASATAAAGQKSYCPTDCTRVLPIDPTEYSLPSNELDLFLNAIPAVTEATISLETPIQFHVAMTVASSLFNLVSAYDDKALDFFGQRGTKFLPCCNTQDQLDLHRTAAVGYFWLHMGRYLGSPELFDQLAANFGASPSKFDTITDPALPEGWAKLISDDFIEYVTTDGWNADGKETNRFNPVPYQDTTGYCPRTGDETRWQPLLVPDGKGGTIEQSHVTPHIGRTARLYLLSEKQFQKRKAPPPNYNYKNEVRKLLGRSAKLGRDEKEQAKVELYDAKFTSVIPILVQMAIKIPSSSRSVLHLMGYILALDAAALESVTLVWKEKLKYDLVRPPTRIVTELGPDAMVLAYAGPGEGTKRIKASEWRPYIGTMPHSEYPSASACICQAAMEVGVQYNGGPNISALKPTIFLSEGTSIVQPGFPTKDQVFVYRNAADMVNDCANSRLTGGLHFTKATGAGKKLCKGLGNIAVKKVAKLLKGDPCGKFGDFSDGKPDVRKAPRRPNGVC